MTSLSNGFGSSLYSALDMRTPRSSSEARSSSSEHEIAWVSSL